MPDEEMQDAAEEPEEASSSEDEEEDDEEWREYPIWLQPAVKEEAQEASVRVLDADDSGEAPKEVDGKTRIRVKAVELPDTLQHAIGKRAQRQRVTEGSVVLVSSGPDSAPYIGLVTKIWRKRGARCEQRDGTKWYLPRHFWFDLYYFYRYDEAPQEPANGPASLKAAMHGGRLRVPPGARGKARDVAGGGSERQLMFSNHSNWGDGQDICAESFLYCAKVHWMEGKEQFPRVYFEDGGALRQRLAPGFSVRCFHYFERPPSEGPGRVYPLDREWPHAETWTLARRLRQVYKQQDAERAGANERLLAKHAAARDAAARQPPSPSLRGSELGGGGGGGSRGGGGGGGGSGSGAEHG